MADVDAEVLLEARRLGALFNERLAADVPQHGRELCRLPAVSP